MTRETENRLMQGITVAVLSEDREQAVVLNTRLEATHLARVVFSHTSFPLGPSDPILRQIQDHRAEVVLVDIDPQSPQRAVRAIELIQGSTSEISIFALGEIDLLNTTAST